MKKRPDATVVMSRKQARGVAFCLEHHALSGRKVVLAIRGQRIVVTNPVRK